MPIIFFKPLLHDVQVEIVREIKRCAYRRYIGLRVAQSIGELGVAIGLLALITNVAAYSLAHARGVPLEAPIVSALFLFICLPWLAASAAALCYAHLQKSLQPVVRAAARAVRPI